MKFLFRTPLFDFDPENESEIKENWLKILEAISVSSPSLAQEIRDQCFEELAKPIKIKVKKYILRGRYRSTPFGKFAGVGLGSDIVQKFTVDLQQVVELGSTFFKEKANVYSDEWHLSLSIFNQFDRKMFLSYQIKEERWALLGIPPNKIISLLENHHKTHTGIRFNEFRLWFREETQDCIKDVWNHLIKMGVLYLSEDWLRTQITPSLYTDTVVTDQLGVEEEIKSAVEDLFQTGGHFFSKVTSAYLQRLRRWFAIKIDDRFIPLPLLLRYQEFTGSDFLDLSSNGESQKTPVEFPVSIWECEEVDLKMLVKETPLDLEIFNIDLVFKALDDGRIVVDNALCNRPFSLIGRFNRHEGIFEFEEEIRASIYPYKELIYAEVRVFETHAVQGICATCPLFEKYISPFYQEDPNCIPFEDIEMGLRDGEFILVHGKSGKRIIPVIPHPLNGKEISHPIIRLLWELDHQKSFHLTPFPSPLFSSSSYAPRLTWGKVVLQSRRWVIYSYQFDLPEDLKRWCYEQGLPSNILVGIYDRELLVNWESEEGFEILWSELVKYPRCVLSEAIWKDRSPYTSTNGKPIYPQLVISQRKPIAEQLWTGFLNSIEDENHAWLYVVFWVVEDDFEDFMLSLLSVQFLNILKNRRIRWYYLVYPDEEQLQVRMRFHPTSSDQKGELLYQIVSNLGPQQRFEQRPYYPETKKYGDITFLISEELFWMECCLIAEIIQNTRSLSGLSRISVACLSHFWVELIGLANMQCHAFKMIKFRIKKMPYELKRRFATELANNQLRKLPAAWKKDYHAKLLQHLSHWKSTKMKWQLISNHLHMQVNRFYSIDRKENEDWLYYLLYKELGKRIYGKGSGD